MILTRIVTIITYLCDGNDCASTADSEDGRLPSDPPPQGHAGYRRPWVRRGTKHLCPPCGVDHDAAERDRDRRAIIADMGLGK